MRFNTALFLLLIPSQISLASTYHGTPKIDHYRCVKALWDAKMGSYKQEELVDFYRATWMGAHGNKECLAALSAISILECNQDADLRAKKGYLGGQHKTIKKGLLELKIQPIGRVSTYWKTAALSRRFYVLYRHYGSIEKTCRVWNLGADWQEADKYWAGVKQFEAIYSLPAQPTGAGSHNHSWNE